MSQCTIEIPLRNPGLKDWNSSIQIRFPLYKNTTEKVNNGIMCVWNRVISQSLSTVFYKNHIGSTKTIDN